MDQIDHNKSPLLMRNGRNAKGFRRPSERFRRRYSAGWDHAESAEPADFRADIIRRGRKMIIRNLSAIISGRRVGHDRMVAEMSEIDPHELAAIFGIRPSDIPA